MPLPPVIATCPALWLGLLLATPLATYAAGPAAPPPAAATTAPPALSVQDISVLAGTCANCHGPDGRSSGAIPALRGASADDGAGLAEVVARLADDLRGVGHSVEAVCEVGTVPHSVELAADRVLREAMTNIVKHGGASTSCTLSVREVTGWLEIDVANEVRAERLADLGSTRLGIVGLAERVELLGGSLDAGLDGGRWRVRVRLPLL